MYKKIKLLIISVMLFLFLVGGIFLAGFIYLLEPGPEGKAQYLYSIGRLWFYKHALTDTLSSKERKRLYQSTCTRKCHGSDVIEKTPRTAMEWERIISRMKAPDRAAITDREAAAIVGYLQEHYLSKIPTILPEKTMRFLKRHLWRSDFGANDIYLDLIYLPQVHRDFLLPYLVGSNTPSSYKEGIAFVLYANTHQGILPPWNFAKMAVLQYNKGPELKARAWDIVYDDGQAHHRQGMLTFPRSDENEEELTALEVEIDLPGMRSKVFQWTLPVPPIEENIEEK